MLNFFKRNQEPQSTAPASFPQQTTSLAGGINLVKGERISLTKDNPHLDEIQVGLGWDVNESRGSAYDLDASVFLLGANGKTQRSKDCVYFGNLKSADGSVRHTGDNLTGEGDGDDEVIKVALSKVSPTVERILFTVSIYQARSRRQTFGNVSNAFIRVLDKKTGRELVRFNLTDDYKSAHSVIVAELYRHEGQWKFNAIGNGVQDEIGGLKEKFM